MTMMMTIPRVKNTLSYALEQAWCVVLQRDANEVAVSFDEGIVVIKLGWDEPTFSMDPSGKLIYTHNHNVLSGNLQMIFEDSNISEGAQVPLSIKEIGSTKIFAQSLMCTLPLDALSLLLETASTSHTPPSLGRTNPSEMASPSHGHQTLISQPDGDDSENENEMESEDGAPCWTTMKHPVTEVP
ncbi:hypothetical protein L208DRAFT_1380098 [Tricholoma matsutake]|nr:hypothetical protein L208DRAFT_1380098 [Tricholoma matsutake 945]